MRTTSTVTVRLDNTIKDWVNERAQALGQKPSKTIAQILYDAMMEEGRP
jgi:hypothetical protein